jgi:hypothetical protein
MILGKKLHIAILNIIFIVGLFLINNPNIYGQETMEDATLSVDFSEEDGRKTVIATAVDQFGVPIEELDLYFYVKRTFSLLPIGDIFNSTDENGVVEVQFPDDLPGDTEGNIILVVKIIESDLYNDLSLEITKNWGIPAQIDQAEEKRSLWAAAANAPITLVIAVSGMILVIWFIIFYIIFVLFKISKITPIKT